MKNLSTLKNVFALVSILFTLGLTACSDSGGTKSKASTQTCPSNAYYDTIESEWYVSQNQLTICNPLPGVQPHGCQSGFVKVRSPYQYDVNFDVRTNNLNNVDPNYHYNHGGFNEICMQPNGPSWSHVSNAGFYYYVNIGLINTTIFGNAVITTPPIIYYPQNNNNTGVILALGVLAALLIL